MREAATICRLRALCFQSHWRESHCYLKEEKNEEEGSSDKHVVVWTRVFTEFFCALLSSAICSVACASAVSCFSVFVLKKKKRERRAWWWTQQRSEPSVLSMLLKIKACHHFQLRYVILLSRWSLLCCLFSFLRAFSSRWEWKTSHSTTAAVSPVMKSQNTDSRSQLKSSKHIVFLFSSLLCRWVPHCVCDECKYDGSVWDQSSPPLCLNTLFWDVDSVHCFAESWQATSHRVWKHTSATHRDRAFAGF